MKRWTLPMIAAVSLLMSFSATPRADEADAGSHAQMGVAEMAPGNLAPPAGLTGFRPDSIDAELAREARAASLIRPDTLRRHLRILTEEPHVAGTPADGIPVLTRVICTDKCNYQPDCIGFNFFEGNSTCQLKTYLSQATFDKNAIAIPGCKFYYRV